MPLRIILITLVLFIVLSTEISFAQQDLPLSDHNSDNYNTEKCNIAGLQVAVWHPQASSKKWPLVIFSHGFRGYNTQSTFIMEAIAKAGYLVIAPNHKDALGQGNFMAKPERPFRQAEIWDDSVYKGRADDIINLINALHKDPKWNNQIDWSKVVLAGHSLGGYTVLALAGAWPSWKQKNLKAILALSPYCEPFVDNGNLGNIGIPVMYQGGTRDLGITPTIKNLRGALSKASSPTYFIEFDKMGHLGWTNRNHDQKQRDLINYYCLAFLNKYVKGDANARPNVKLSGVSDLKTK